MNTFLVTPRTFKVRTAQYVDNTLVVVLPQVFGNTSTCPGYRSMIYTNLAKDDNPICIDNHVDGCDGTPKPGYESSKICIGAAWDVYIGCNDDGNMISLNHVEVDKIVKPYDPSTYYFNNEIVVCSNSNRTNCSSTNPYPQLRMDGFDYSTLGYYPENWLQIPPGSGGGFDAQIPFNCSLFKEVFIECSHTPQGYVCQEKAGLRAVHSSITLILVFTFYFCYFDNL